MGFRNVEAEKALLADLRRRVHLSSAALPSVCLSTVLNAHATLNSIGITLDGALIAGGFSDASIRVREEGGRAEKPRGPQWLSELRV